MARNRNKTQEAPKAEDTTQAEGAQGAQAFDLDAVRYHSSDGTDLIAHSDLHPKTVAWMAQRTISHVTGNELARARGQWKDKKAEDGESALYDAGEIDTLADGWLADRLAAWKAGTVGTRGPGVSKVRDLQSFVNEAAVTYIRAQVQKAKKAGRTVKMPTGDDLVTYITKVLAGKPGTMVRAEGQKAFDSYTALRGTVTEDDDSLDELFGADDATGDESGETTENNE